MKYGSCTPDSGTSDAIETALFGGGDVITKETGYYMCIAKKSASYIIVASNKDTGGDKTITLTANGIWTGK